jgi:CBS domain-containing protein
MKARDVMVSPVITVKPSFSVKEVAKTFLERRISAAPVVDDQGKLVGIVSEGDLMHRAEAGTERQRSWWLRALTAEETLAAEYVKAHARKVADVMTRDVITATADTPLHEIAALLEKNSIKRVPIVKNGQLVGIVSRANLIQAGGQHPQRTGNPALRHHHPRQTARPSKGATVGAHLAAERHGECRCRRHLGYHDVGRREGGNSGGC